MAFGVLLAPRARSVMRMVTVHTMAPEWMVWIRRGAPFLAFHKQIGPAAPGNMILACFLDLAPDWIGYARDVPVMAFVRIMVPRAGATDWWHSLTRWPRGLMVTRRGLFCHGIRRHDGPRRTRGGGAMVFAPPLAPE